MISDFVKGRDQFSFSGNIQKGIALHRMIDGFTDSHPATKKAMEVFRPHYRLYSAPLMDILYDYFIANDKNLFDDASLKEFSNNTYRHLENNSTYLPNRFLHMFTYMKTEDWLYNYRYHEGIKKSLQGLVRRASFIRESDTAFNLFLAHQYYLQECYEEFFPDVKLFAKQRFDELTA